MSKRLMVDSSLLGGKGFVSQSEAKKIAMESVVPPTAPSLELKPEEFETIQKVEVVEDGEDIVTTIKIKKPPELSEASLASLRDHIKKAKDSVGTMKDIVDESTTGSQAVKMAIRKKNKG